MTNALNKSPGKLCLENNIRRQIRTEVCHFPALLKTLTDSDINYTLRKEFSNWLKHVWDD